MDAAAADRVLGAALAATTAAGARSGRGEVWLITGRRAMPTVADLLTDGGQRPDAGSAATILVEIAQTLLSVHAAGLSHGE